MGLLPCIKCGEEGQVRLNLDDGDTCYCSSCDGEFSADDVRGLIATWAPVLKWLELHPARNEQREPATVATEAA